MNAERQLIGSLLIDQSRYESVDFINSEMFMDPILGKIFSVYEHAEGEVNPLTLIPVLRSDFYTDTVLQEMFQKLVVEHDGSVSDKSCAEDIFSKYKVNKLNEYLSHTQITPQKIDSILADLRGVIESFDKMSDECDIASLSDLTLFKDNYFTPKNEKNIRLGFPKVDKAIGGFDGGDVTIIAARPSVGKSAFALQAIRKFGMDGLKVGYFNLEMAKKQIYERSIASASGIDLNRIRLGTNFLNDEKSLFDKGNEQLFKEKNVFVISGIQTIRSIRQIQKKYGFQIIVIDYLQLIKVESKRNGNRANEVGDISRGLKAIASEFDIPVIALSQLNRVSEHNKDKEPSLSELRESGDLEQDASTVIMLWNSNKDDLSEKMMKIEKSRNGTNDRVKLYFDGKHMTFTDFDEREQSFHDSDIPDEIPFE